MCYYIFLRVLRVEICLVRSFHCHIADIEPLMEHNFKNFHSIRNQQLFSTVLEKSGLNDSED